jgi:hypothetical protein
MESHGAVQSVVSGVEQDISFVLDLLQIFSLSISP